MNSANSQLSHAIDQVNAAYFWGEKLPKDERAKLAATITAAHDGPGAYAHTFALSASERKGVVLFSGERATNASARHISGEEACRALRLLNVRDRAATDALKRASDSLTECLERAEAATDRRMGGNPGIYCCGRCSVSVWRHIAAGGFDRHEERLTRGVRRLKDFRDGDGRWSVFPFWYAMSALAEIDVLEAKSEIRYAAPILERAAKQKEPGDEHDRRRREIARRALARL